MPIDIVSFRQGINSSTILTYANLIRSKLNFPALKAQFVYDLEERFVPLRKFESRSVKPSQKERFSIRLM